MFLSKELASREVLFFEFRIPSPDFLNGNIGLKELQNELYRDASIPN